MTQLNKYFSLWRPSTDYFWNQYEVQKAKNVFFQQFARLLQLPIEINAENLIQSHILEEICEQGEQWIEENLWNLCLEDSPILHQEMALIFRCLVVNYAKTQIDFFVNKCKKHLSYKEQQDICQELKCLLLYDAGNLLPCTFYYNNDLSLREASFKFEQSKQLTFSAFVLEGYHHFNPSRQSLKNWTYKRIIQYPGVKDVLKMYGIVIRSTLSYLSKLSMRVLIDIELKFGLRVTKNEVTIYQQLLHIIKEVRISMVGQRLTYDMIFEEVLRQNLAIPTIEELKKTLNEMRNLIEDYENRVHHISIEQPNQQDDSSYSLIDRLGISSQDCFEQLDDYQKKQLQIEIVPHIENNFVPKYRASKEIWLRSGIKEAIENRLEYLQNHHHSSMQEKSSLFLPALSHIYCENMTVSQVAKHFRFQSQTELSRLVKLTVAWKKVEEGLIDGLIFNSLINTIKLLEQEFKNYVQEYLNQEHQKLINNEPNLWISLIKEELLELAQICNEGRKEIHDPKKQTKTSIFSQLMCSVIQSFEF
jgi:hypothetical protein